VETERYAKDGSRKLESGTFVFPDIDWRPTLVTAGTGTMNETQRVSDAGFSGRRERLVGSRPLKPVPPDLQENRNRSKPAPASPKHAIPYQPRGAQLPVLVYSWRPPAKSSQPPSRCLVTYNCFIPVSALPGHRTHQLFRRPNIAPASPPSPLSFASSVKPARCAGPHLDESPVRSFEFGGRERSASASRD